MQPLPIRRFSTATFREHERHEAWSHRHFPSYAAAVIATPAGPFAARSEEIGLGAATLFYGSYSEQSMQRTQAMARSDGYDHLGLCVALGGELAGDDHRIGAGGMMLSDLTMPMRNHATECRTVTVMLPRAMVAAAGIDARRCHLLGFDPGDAALLRSHLLRFRRLAPRLTVADAPVALRGIVDLLRLTLAASGRDVALMPVERPSPDDQMRLALDLIDARLGEADLGVGTLCRQLGVSRSTLYRMFDTVGGVRGYIRDRRLDTARAALLADPCGPSIAAIAERHGFDDAAHFSRAFRSRFGCSPRAARGGGSI